jgi:LysR family transcriptional regulator, glycine cleavage system transcriptional activator
MRRLPPLRALRAFEASARLASVTAAAAELGVSHSAVSQQIRQLEDYFGLTLFRRSGRGIEPTPQAALYLRDVAAGLDRIAIASEQLSQRGHGRVLRVNATPSFAMRWLIPQTSAFQLDNPAIDLRISVSTSDGIEHLTEPADFIIRRDVMARGDHVCRRFLDDVSTAVVSPALAGQQRLDDPRSLLKLPLLHLRSRPDAWRRWFQGSGVVMPDTIAGPFFDHFFLSLQAAISGLGAAIGPYALIADDLAAGRLVTPFADRTVVGPGFHVLYRAAAVKERAGRMFLDWLLARAPGESRPAIPQ